MKGQYMFLLCVILLFSLIAFRVGMDYTVLQKNEEIFSSIYANKVNKMIVEQIEKSILISASNRSYIEENLKEFVNYIKNSYSFEILTITINIPVVRAYENTTFNVTVFNAYEKEVTNVRLNFSYDNIERLIDRIGPKESVKLSFTFNVSQDSVFQLKVSYTIRENREKTIIVPVFINKQMFSYYFIAEFLNGQMEEVNNYF